MGSRRWNRAGIEPVPPSPLRFTAACPSSRNITASMLGAAFTDRTRLYRVRHTHRHRTLSRPPPGGATTAVHLTPVRRRSRFSRGYRASPPRPATILAESVREPAVLSGLSPALPPLEASLFRATLTLKSSPWGTDPGSPHSLAQLNLHFPTLYPLVPTALLQRLLLCAPDPRNRQYDRVYIMLLHDAANVRPAT